MIRLAFTVLWTLGIVAQGWAAYLMCFTVTSLGGYLPFAMFTLPMLLCGLLLHALAKSTD